MNQGALIEELLFGTNPILTVSRDKRVTSADPERSVCHNQELGIGGRQMAGGRPPSFISFTCPNCQALYQLIRHEVGPETDNCGITCRDRGAPFPARDGKFVLKCFMLR